MKLREIIFDSKSESEVFRSLRTRWSPKLSLYPSLPLSKIIQIDPDELKPKEREFFYKTSVDYTFCQLDGRPIRHYTGYLERSVSSFSYHRLYLELD